MKDHPLLFTSEMVKAILEGRKIQTRRVPVERYLNWQVGDVLWVRETWCLGSGSWPGYKTYTEPTTKGHGGAIYPVLYRANQLANDADHKWRPSIHMFKWATRIWLEITKMRVERVQDISETDAIAEGIDRKLLPYDVADPEKAYLYDGTATNLFKNLWNSLNAKRGYGWDKNPQVKVIEFKNME